MALRKDIREYLELRASEGDRRAAHLARQLAGGSIRKRSLGAAADYAEKRQAAEEAADDGAKRLMHDQVFAWNRKHTRERGAVHGRCDCGCGGRFLHKDHGECDHWIERSQGGEHSRANGWRLLPDCHRRKTDREPPLGDGSPSWNVRRQTYCVCAGIAFVPRKEAGEP